MRIALFKLHHSIAGSVEVLFGVFSGTGATGGDFVRFLLLGVIGNAIGGVTFVALLKYAHIRQRDRHAAWRLRRCGARAPFPGTCRTGRPGRASRWRARTCGTLRDARALAAPGCAR